MDALPPQAGFTLDDFRAFLVRICKLGYVPKIVSMLPWTNALRGENIEAELKRLVGILDMMTPEELRSSTCNIGQARRQRIAVEAGVAAREVDELIQQFELTADLMGKLANKSMFERLRSLRHFGE